MKFWLRCVCVLLIGTNVCFSNPIGLYQFSLEGIECICDGQTNQFFYSTPIENTNLLLTVNFDDTQIHELLINNNKVSCEEVFLFDLNEEKEFEIDLLLLNGEREKYTLIFTTLPLVCINTNERDIPKENKIPCTFTLIDPYSRSNGGSKHYSHYAGIRVRGGTSSGYPKKSYAIEIRDDSENEVNASFLGLREDGDWILDAMYIDRSRMRNRVCMDIWNSFNDVPHINEEPEAINGTRGEFVEVFLNGAYNGIYCMSEKVDRKQLKVKKDLDTGGVVFKGKQWTDATLMNGYNFNADQSGIRWCGWASKYPSIPGYSKFDLLTDFISIASLDMNPDPAVFEGNMEKFIYFDNLIDFVLFSAAVHADDNIFKNSFLSVYNLKKDRRFFITPWDLDATFGRSWDGTLVNKYAFKSNQFDYSSLTRRLFSENPLNFYRKLKNRWNEVKGNELSVEKVSERIDSYKDIYLFSNAYNREKQLWGATYKDIVQETEMMKRWYTENYRIIEEYMANISVNIEMDGEELFAQVYVHDKCLIIESENELILEVFDTSGKLVISQLHSLPFTSIEFKNNGLYIVVLKDSSSLSLATKKILVY